MIHPRYYLHYDVEENPAAEQGVLVVTENAILANTHVQDETTLRDIVEDAGETYSIAKDIFDDELIAIVLMYNDRNEPIRQDVVIEAVLDVTEHKVLSMETEKLLLHCGYRYKDQVQGGNPDYVGFYEHSEHSMLGVKLNPVGHGHVLVEI